MQRGCVKTRYDFLKVEIQVDFSLHKTEIVEFLILKWY